MKLVRHKIVEAPFTPARQVGGEIVPTIVILHDTAGRIDKGNSAAFLASAPKVSVHFVVERDGSVVQQVPTNRRAAHAGQSSYHGRAGCNDFSVGIEIVNPGRLVEVAPGVGRAWFKQTFRDGEEAGDNLLRTPEAALATHGPGLWMDYPEAQVAAVEALLVALFAGIPTLRDVTTHWYVSPGRKVDTNPFFPLESLRSRVLGRDDPAEEEADAGSTAEADEWARVTTSGTGLNLRRWPSFNPNIIGTVPAGTLVPVLRQGSFGGELWRQVRFDGREGWVVGRYTTPVTRAAA